MTDDFVFGRATTTEEIEAVQRLRYTVYVEELGRYRDAAGAGDGRMAEPEDENSWVFYGRVGDRVVAATRMTWGSHGFSRRQIEQYRLAPFLEEIPLEMMAVGERNSVLPEYRGTGVFDELTAFGGEFSMTHPLRLVFGCCEPHLLPLFIKQGCRPYSTHNINGASGYLIPIISFVPDVDALRGVGSAKSSEDFPPCIEQVLNRSGSVRSEVLSSAAEYWGDIRRTLDELNAQRISAFDGFSDDEAQRCIARSAIIECAAGDRVLKRGGSARNIFVVLDGTLEVRDGERLVGVLSAGDAFGEMAFLLERPRSFDVDAATDNTRVLSLSEGALRKMIAEDATVAAKLLLNVSKMLCVRLMKPTFHAANPAIAGNRWNAVFSSGVGPRMNPGHTVTITPADLHVVVTVGGETIAETRHPVVLEETGLPTRYYLRPEDVRMDLLRSTTFSTQCPFKGQASYWTLELGGETHDGIVWSYEHPIPGAEGIAGLLCFYNDRVELEVGS